MYTASVLLALGLAAHQAVATGSSWTDKPSFSSPHNTPTTCSNQQSGGFDWSGINAGQAPGSYGGCAFTGVTCQNQGPSGSFKKRGLQARTNGIQDKCVSGNISSGDKSKYPSIKAGAGSGAGSTFSPSTYHVSCSYDTMVDFEYTMPDGSKCTHTSSCNAAGNSVSNTQCGGATSVTCSENQAHKSSNGHTGKTCSLGIHSIGFQCGPQTSIVPSKPATSASKPATSAPASSKPATSVAVSSTPATSAPASSKPATSAPASSKPASSVCEGYSCTAGKPASSTPAATTSVPAISVPATTVPGSTAPISTSYTNGTSKPATSAPATSAHATSVSVCNGYGCSVASKPASSSSAPAASSSAGSSVPVTSSSAPKTTSPVSSPVTSVYMSTSTVFATTKITVLSCGPEVTNCPVASRTPYVVTSVVAVSTTICPVTATMTPGASSTPAASVASSSAAAASKSSSSSAPAASSPVPVSCPDVVPSCINTLLSSIETKCRDNTDVACFCAASNHTSFIQQCITSHGADSAEISSALSYFSGLCAAQILQNPSIVVNTPPGAPSNAPALPPTITAGANVPVTTITVQYTTTFCPVTATMNGTAMTNTGVTTTKTTSTVVTVPQVQIQTFTAPAAAGATGAAATPSVGLAPGAPPMVEAGATSSAAAAMGSSAPSAPAYGAPAPTTLAGVAAPSTGGFASSPTGSPIHTGAASAFGVSGGAAVVALFAAIMI